MRYELNLDVDALKKSWTDASITPEMFMRFTQSVGQRFVQTASSDAAAELQTHEAEVRDFINAKAAQYGFELKPNMSMSPEELVNDLRISGRATDPVADYFRQQNRYQRRPA